MKASAEIAGALAAVGKRVLPVLYTDAENGAGPETGRPVRGKPAPFGPETEQTAFFRPMVSLRDGAKTGCEGFFACGGAEKLPDMRPDVSLCADCLSLQNCFAALLTAFARLGGENNLFLRIPAGVLCKLLFQQKHLLDQPAFFEVPPENICVEIVGLDGKETSLEQVLSAADLLRRRRFKLALGGIGGGQPDVSLILHLRPQFVMLGAPLVERLDTDSFRQSLVKSVCEFCRSADITAVADGVQTRSELEALVGAGAHQARGVCVAPFAVREPHLHEGVTDFIRVCNSDRNHMLFHTISEVYIGHFRSDGTTTGPGTPGEEVYAMLMHSGNVQEIAVVGPDGRVGGLVTRTRIDHMLSGQFGYSLHAKRPVSLIMDRTPLIVDYTAPIDAVSRMAMARPAEKLYDCIIVTREGRYEGIVTIKTLLEKSMEIEVSNARHLNPLTGLPGNRIIEQHLRHVCVNTRNPFTVLYIDIDNFKAYNDVYGFEKGDGIIAMLAEAMHHAVPESGFIGHVGGDDFIAVLETYDVQQICQTLIDTFDGNVPLFYSPQDRARGFIVAKSRKDEEEQFPIMSISVAGISNRRQEFHDVCELAEYAGAIKKRCKQQWHSCFIIE